MKLINWIYYWLGIVFLSLAKAKSIIYGYSTPKNFSIDEFQRCVEYDINVVDGWIEQLEKYTNGEKYSSLKNITAL